jgi:hypothetical protein
MQLEILALRHQLAVDQYCVKRPKLQPADRFFWESCRSEELDQRRRLTSELDEM